MFQYGLVLAEEQTEWETTSFSNRRLQKQFWTHVPHSAYTCTYKYVFLPDLKAWPSGRFLPWSDLQNGGPEVLSTVESMLLTLVVISSGRSLRTKCGFLLKNLNLKIYISKSSAWFSNIWQSEAPINHSYNVNKQSRSICIRSIIFVLCSDKMYVQLVLINCRFQGLI